MAQVMPPILMVVSKVATTEKFMLLSIKTQAQISTPRQPDAERRAAGLTFELNPALMFVKNLLANIQPHAAPFARRFRREEGLENARLDLVGNAAAGIGDFNDDS